MATYEWNESDSVKVQEFDDHHKKLFRMVNDLNEAMRQGKGRDVTGNLLKVLVGYTKVHFQAEEKCFDEYGYPDMENHKKEHAKFVKTISDSLEQYNSGSLALTAKLLAFLCDWIKGHINGTDKKYSVFFNEKGLK